MRNRLKIIKCSNLSEWHSDYIGGYFEEYERLHDIPFYTVYSPFDECDHFVPIEDAEEVSYEPEVLDNTVSKGDPTYLKLLDDMRELHIKKNAGYSGDSKDRWANFRLSESFGVSPFLGVMVRMSDKWIRITSQVKNPSFDKIGEAIEDTLMDLASYALIAICILKERKE